MDNRYIVFLSVKFKEILGSKNKQLILFAMLFVEFLSKVFMTTLGKLKKSDHMDKKFLKCISYEKPRNYWEEYSAFFRNKGREKYYKQHELILETLKTVEWNNIIEIGCGFGRNLRLIRNNFNNKLIVGVDFSFGMVSQCRDYVNDRSVMCFCASAVKLGVKDSCFDVVLCHGLLMHIPPDDIRSAVLEIKRVCRNIIIIVEKIETKKRHKAKNWFSHDYTAFFMDSGVSSERTERIDDLIFSVFNKK